MREDLSVVTKTNIKIPKSQQISGTICERPRQAVGTEFLKK